MRASEPGPITRFHEKAYAKFFDTIKEQILEYAARYPEKTHYTMAGAGPGVFLGGLEFTNPDNAKNTAFRNQAQQIGIERLVEVALELRARGVTVDFTERVPNPPIVSPSGQQQKPLYALINERLGRLEQTSGPDADPKLFEHLTLTGEMPNKNIKPGAVL